MNIPVFLSCPSTLSSDQDLARRMILKELERVNLEPRALGRSDYPTEIPLREVLLLAKHCSGGVILGFEQFFSPTSQEKRNTSVAKVHRSKRFPTAWNHLEAGILFTLNLPLLVFREEGIEGGVFDEGVSTVFVHRMPDPKDPPKVRKALTAVFQKWQAAVRTHYYR